MSLSNEQRRTKNEPKRATEPRQRTLVLFVGISTDLTSFSFVACSLSVRRRRFVVRRPHHRHARRPAASSASIHACLAAFFVCSTAHLSCRCQPGNSRTCRTPNYVRLLPVFPVSCQSLPSPAWRPDATQQLEAPHTASLCAPDRRTLPPVAPALAVLLCSRPLQRGWSVRRFWNGTCLATGVLLFARVDYLETGRKRYASAMGRR